MEMSHKLFAVTLATTIFGLSQSALAAGPTMVIQADTVLSGRCVLASQFNREDRIVWRMRVIDAASGVSLDQNGLASVVVKMSDGTELQAHFGDHPPDNPVDAYWTAAWSIPADYPTGSFSYTVTATNKNGDTARFVPFQVPASQLTVVAAQ